MSKQDEGWPVLLKTQSSEAGAVLREFAEETAAPSNEAAAYAREIARLDRPSGRPRWWWVLGTAALTVFVALWQWRSGEPAVATRAPAGSTGTTVSTAAPAATPTPVTANLPSFPLGTVPSALPIGKTLLPGAVAAELAAGAVATGRLQNGTLDIVLGAGSIALRVPPREIGQAVLVNAGEHRFTVVGTVFRLSRTAGRLDLAVSEGLVAVTTAADHVATVATGEHWASALSAPVPRRRELSPRIARTPSLRDCARFPPEETPRKIACYQEQARRGGPDGERAQHALARYLRDDVADVTGALAAFEAQRSRYPRGELRADADRAVIELLPRLGRHAEALVETQTFLDAHPDAEDRAEIRLVRGDIYRAIFQDVTSAEREYDEGAEAGGRTGDDSRFLRALCLEALGRVDEARSAYRDYLAQAEPAHAREATRRMQRLAR